MSTKRLPEACFQSLPYPATVLVCCYAWLHTTTLVFCSRKEAEGCPWSYIRFSCRLRERSREPCLNRGPLRSFGSLRFQRLVKSPVPPSRLQVAIISFTKVIGDSMTCHHYAFPRLRNVFVGVQLPSCQRPIPSTAKQLS